MGNRWEIGLFIALLIGSGGAFFLPAKTKLAAVRAPARIFLYPFNWLKIQSLNIIRYRRDNERLARQVSELECANIALRENRKRPGSTPDLGGYRLTGARIVGRDPQTFVRTLLLDRGGRAGIAPGMAVIGSGGFIGKVVEVQPDQALVETIRSPDLRVGVLDQRSRVVGVVRGALLTMEYVARDEDVRPGDTVVTSGLGGMFPPGLPIGLVATTGDKAGGIFKKIVVVPFTSVAVLEQVSVITSVLEQTRAVEASAESAATRQTETIRRAEFRTEPRPAPPRRIEASLPF